MWIRCVESGPNESKIDPPSRKRTRRFTAPVHFQMPTLAILASPARFRRFRFQRTCTFSTHPYIFTLARVFALTHAFLASPVRF
ncbi:hypothetical protein PAXRUDRAFT_836169 [Paxillus rubicundulus Ve08.2h10]|uniref:Uncharacterized protein n=1 Tax=Paxillus rubicundulus Ve08.2h10 TaxID=930991 RepID=A0A0D0D1N5_9AGAM|nr:hypothetical protein PAXRUDRAFT_836169 [Paxillus rubicundulus Ve08.2h10]